MASKLVDEYAAADAAGKVDIIFRNYPTFIGSIDSRIEGLVYLIEDEKACKRRSGRGELGVRVQTSGTSNPTQNIGMSEVMTRDALISCDFSGGVLDDTDNEEEYMFEAYMLQDMRRDFFLFNSQLGSIEGKKKEVFNAYINRNKDVVAIADEFGIVEQSARNMIHRTKKKIEGQMLDCMIRRYGRNKICQQERQRSIA